MSDVMLPMIIGTAVLLAIFAWVGSIIYRWIRPSGRVTVNGPLICPACGSRGTPKTQTRGSTWIELILWLCLIVPGLIYSVWRLTTRQKVCPECTALGMIPVNSPRGKQLMTQYATPP